ncbi:hypothetical protein V492_00490 [Pseudogymnoascus sp. VKM F-4246]|nr:hypothetical protein V492_00490 [Pseudogymnoascus sp. VKM F-4246]
MTTHSSNEKTVGGPLEGQPHHQGTTAEDSQGQHYHQYATPADLQEAPHYQGTIVFTDIILDMIVCIDKNTIYDDPLCDLASLYAQRENIHLSLSLSLSLLIEQALIPKVAPLLDRMHFDAVFKKSRFALDSTIMPTALPLSLKQEDNAAHPALYYGCVFFAAYQSFSDELDQVFWDNIDIIKANNSDLYLGEDSLAPLLTMHNRRDDVTLLSELLAMLLQLAYKASYDGIYPSGQLLLLTLLTNMYESSKAPLSVLMSTLTMSTFESVSEQVPYVDEKTYTIMPDTWKWLLGWTFGWAAKAERSTENH